MPVNDIASDAAALRAPLELIMREAGQIARETARGEFKRWTKGHDNSPVSEGDIAVNNFLRARLGALAPAAGWLSEETEDEPAARAMDTVWIVDPIDGTRAYITHRHDWTVSVALVTAGRPQLAALYAPVTDEMFLAVAGRGATRNAVPIAVSPGAGLSGARLAGPKRVLDRITALTPETRPQDKVFSLALRLTRVAEGAFEAALSTPGSHDWDLAAADLLVHEAGGVLTDVAGRGLRYNQPKTDHGALIAAGPARHGTLIDLMRDRLPEFA
ncbi:MAG: 3'(2'),5'-bisphosphate nucleotidase CysQ [Proteobacteria bacterium]|nr:3'(2'),5'-bisphosphate nucleotidase CysQ [Pseudomonadota bacterium]